MKFKPDEDRRRRYTRAVVVGIYISSFFSMMIGVFCSYNSFTTLGITFYWMSLFYIIDYGRKNIKKYMEKTRAEIEQSIDDYKDTTINGIKLTEALGLMTIKNELLEENRQLQQDVIATLELKIFSLENK